MLFLFLSLSILSWQSDLASLICLSIGIISNLIFISNRSKFVDTVSVYSIPVLLMSFLYVVVANFNELAINGTSSIVFKTSVENGWASIRHAAAYPLIFVAGLHAFRSSQRQIDQTNSRDHAFLRGFKLAALISALALAANYTVYFIAIRGGGYVAYHNAATGPYKYAMFSLFAFFAFFILSANNWKQLKKTNRILCAALVFVFLHLHIFLYNVRTPILSLALACIFFIEQNRKIKKRYIAITSICILTLFLALPIIRDPDLSAEEGIFNAAFDMVVGLGGYLDTLEYAVKESKHGELLLGGSYVNISENGKNLSMNYAYDTWRDFAEIGGGFGYSPFAEAVMNFGTIGASFFSFFLGVFFKTIPSAFGKWRTPVEAIMISGSFGIIRNQLFASIKFPIYVLISAIIMVTLLRCINHNTARKVLKNEQNRA